MHPAPNSVANTRSGSHRPGLSIKSLLNLSTSLNFSLPPYLADSPASQLMIVVMSGGSAVAMKPKLEQVFHYREADAPMARRQRAVEPIAPRSRRGSGDCMGSRGPRPRWMVHCSHWPPCVCRSAATAIGRWAGSRTAGRMPAGQSKEPPVFGHWLSWHFFWRGYDRTGIGEGGQLALLLAKEGDRVW
jgi:hypothetical protein